MKTPTPPSHKNAELIAAIRSHLQNLKGSLSEIDPAGETPIRLMAAELEQIDSEMENAPTSAAIFERLAAWTVTLTMTLAEEHLRSVAPPIYRAVSRLATAFLLSERLYEIQCGTIASIDEGGETQALEEEIHAALHDVGAQCLILEVNASRTREQISQHALIQHLPH